MHYSSSCEEIPPGRPPNTSQLYLWFIASSSAGVKSVSAGPPHVCFVLSSWCWLLQNTLSAKSQTSHTDSGQNAWRWRTSLHYSVSRFGGPHFASLSHRKHRTFDIRMTSCNMRTSIATSQWNIKLRVVHIIVEVNIIPMDYLIQKKHINSKKQNTKNWPTWQSGWEWEEFSHYNRERSEQNQGSVLSTSSFHSLLF